MRALFDGDDFFVNTGLQKESVFYYTVTDSTNTRAREAYLSSPGLKSSLLFVADGQTAGRGTRGRSFESKRDTGLYLSLLLPKTELSPKENEITPVAAAAVFSSVEELLFKEDSKRLFIKWVNDVFMDKRKISGILTERVVFSGAVAYIIGIGINLYGSDFSPEVRPIAASLEELTGKRIDKASLLSGIVRRLNLAFTDRSEAERLLAAYRKNIIPSGTRITVTDGMKRSRSAVAIGLTEDLRLCVEYENGERASLVSGDISIKF